MPQPRLAVSTWFFGSGVLIVFFGVASPTESQGGIAGDPEHLKVAAEAHKANRDRIKTWQGTAKVEQRLLTQRQPLESLVVFVHDSQSGNFRWNWTIKAAPNHWAKEYADGEMLNGMVRDGKFFRYSSRSTRDAAGNDLPGGTFVIHEVRKMSKKQTLEGYFEPMWHITYPGGGKLDERLMFVYKSKDNPLNEWEVLRNGNMITFRWDGDNTDLQIKDADQPVNHYEIDLSRGANITLAHHWSPDSQITTDYLIDWEQVNDVWVPKSFTYYTVELKDGKKAYEHIREVTWTENLVNDPIPSDAFTVKAVGHGPGDFVSNHFTGESYWVPNLPPRMQQINPAVAEKRKRGN